MPPSARHPRIGSSLVGVIGLHAKQGQIMRAKSRGHSVAFTATDTSPLMLFTAVPSRAWCEGDRPSAESHRFARSRKQSAKIRAHRAITISRIFIEAAESWHD